MTKRLPIYASHSEEIIAYARVDDDDYAHLAAYRWVMQGTPNNTPRLHYSPCSSLTCSRIHLLQSTTAKQCSTLSVCPPYAFQGNSETEFGGLKEMSMRPLIYFDTNIYDHLAKELGVTRTDIENLSSYFRDTAFLCWSFHNLEEISMAVDTSTTTAKDQIQLILKLVQRDHLFKERSTLIMDAVAAVRDGKPPPEPFLYNEQILSGHVNFSSLREIAAAVRTEIQNFHNHMLENWTLARRQLAVDNPSGRRLPFSDCYGRICETLAGALLKGGGVEPTPDRIRTLLMMQFAKAYISATASLLYAWLFEGLKPDCGDSRDLLHAAFAGLADVYVLNDKRFRRILDRVPEREYEIMDLSSFLRHVRLSIGIPNSLS